MLAAARRRIILFGGGARTRTSTFLAFEGILMAKSRKFLTVGALGVGALALIGAGAGASFTASTTSTQTITAGTIGMSVWSPGNAGCPGATSHCKSITLAPVGPVGSTFETPATVIYMTNTGDIPATYDAMTLRETQSSGPGEYLRNQMNVCMKGWDPSAGPDNGTNSFVEGNGPLTTAINLTPSVKENPVIVSPGQTTWYSVDFYAGQDSACGTVSSDGPSTSGIWNAYDGGYVKPASLTNDAMGGSVTPTLTFSFTG
jgi:predicted ribosomally synthesized peptide with SipW-like signal peptide